jgi:creatinine amidohydrolase/Fe(II)-dependent formamide hydrolase-like protein
MICNEQSLSSLRVQDLSFQQINDHLEQCPTLILPVGSLEPHGNFTALGAVNACCEAIADTLSKQLNVLVAPLLSYGNSTPFKSFYGSAGLHHTTLSNVVYECCNCWLFHGFKRIMVLTLSMDGQRGIEEAVKRINSCRGRTDTTRYCSLQNTAAFRSFCAQRYGFTEFERSEWAVLSLTSYLFPEMVRKSTNSLHHERVKESMQKQWHRRGRDPEKLRKMIPDALFSGTDITTAIGQGKELYEYTISMLLDEYLPFLTMGDNVTR